MNRDEKAAAVEGLRDRFGRASVALLATNLGLSAAESRTLRRTLRGAGGELKVAKHTLSRIAMRETRYAKCGELLRGPAGLVFGYRDPVAVTKALVTFAEQHQRLRIEWAAVEGEIIRAERIKALAEMPGLASLQARVARQALSPARRVAASAMAPARRIAGAITSLIERLEAGGA